MAGIPAGKKYSRTAYLIMAALFAAVTGVCSWIAIPLPFTPVPVTLATLSVLMAGSLLGFRYGSLSIIIYVLIGMIGAPVFTAGSSGLGVLAGPTGGYIIGYIIAAAITGLLIDNFTKKATGKKEYLFMAVAMVVATVACYLVGTIWFCFVSSTHFIAALLMCVVPFLAGDALKIVAAILLTKKIRPHML